MPTVTIPRGIAVQQAADALGRQLGSGYEVTARGSGTLAVQHGSLSSATVRVVRDGETTTFRVHGGGPIISRLVNELGIASPRRSGKRSGPCRPADARGGGPSALTRPGGEPYRRDRSPSL